MRVEAREAANGDDLNWVVVEDNISKCSWKNAKPLNEVPLPGAPKYAIRTGSFISAMWEDNNGSNQLEFAYIVAIRDTGSDSVSSDSILLVIVWLRSIRETKQGLKPWMRDLGLDRSSMILSTEFDIIQVSCVADVVLDEPEDNGVVFTRPLSDKNDDKGIAIGLYCHRWYGRRHGCYVNRFHVGTVRVEYAPTTKEQSKTFPTRKRKISAASNEPKNNPKRAKTDESGQSSEATTGITSPSRKQRSRGSREPVHDSSVGTRRHGTDTSSTKPVLLARRSRTTMRPPMEVESSTTLADLDETYDKLTLLGEDSVKNCAENNFKGSQERINHVHSQHEQDRTPSRNVEISPCASKTAGDNYSSLTKSFPEPSTTEPGVKSSTRSETAVCVDKQATSNRVLTAADLQRAALDALALPEATTPRLQPHPLPKAKATMSKPRLIGSRRKKVSQSLITAKKVTNDNDTERRQQHNLTEHAENGLNESKIHSDRQRQWRVAMLEKYSDLQRQRKMDMFRKTLFPGEDKGTMGLRIHSM